MNKVQLIGRLTADPELKQLQGGGDLTSFAVATSRYYKDQSGEKRQETEFSKCVAFGKTAVTLKQYLKKGSQVYIEGRLKTRSWEDQSGQKKYATDIVVENFEFLSAKPKESAQEEPKEETKDIEQAPQAETSGIEDLPF